LPNVNARARFLLVTSHAVQHILSAALPVLLVFIRQDMALSFTEMGLIVAAGNLIAGLAQFPAGILVDMVGAKNMLLFGYVLTLGGLLMFARADTVQAMMLARVITGLGNATFHPASFPEMAKASRQTGVGMGMALHNVGGNVGMSSGYLITGLLAAHMGWREAMTVMVAAGAVLSVLFAFVYPELADDGGEATARRPAKASAVAASGAQPSATAPPAARESFASQWLPTVVLAGAAVLSGAFGNSVTSFLPTFLTETRGVTEVAAAGFSTIALAAGIIGSLGGGKLGDMFDRSKVVLAATVVTTVLVVALAWAPLGAVALAALLVMVGIGHSIPRPSLNAITADVAPGGKSGSAFGMVFGAMSLGGSLASPIVGYIADAASMRVAFGAIAGCFLLHGLMIRRIYGRGRLTARRPEQVAAPAS
jgi:MFS family permease